MDLEDLVCEDDPADGADADKSAEQSGVESIETLRASLVTERAERERLTAEADAAKARASELEAQVQARGDTDKVGAEKQAEQERRLAEQAAEVAKRDQELAETKAKLTAAEQRETDRLAGISKANDTRIAAVPEALRDLVPVALKSDPDALAAWLNTADTKGIFKVAAGVDVNKNPGDRPEPLSAKDAERARNYGLNPDDPADIVLFRTKYAPSFSKLANRATA